MRDQGENYRVFEAGNLGEEAGKLFCFLPDSVRCGEGLGSRHKRGQGLILEAGENHSAISKNGELVRKSNFMEENESGSDFIYLMNTYLTLMMYLALC